MTWGIGSYSATPALNTSVNGINMAEGCAASGVNDAIRQIMADIAGALSNGLMGVPAGSTFWFPVATAPAGFQALDGSAVSRSANPNLFTMIGTTYGAGDGSTTFNVPDWRGRTPVGYDAANVTGRLNNAGEGGIDASAVGNIGGEMHHQLSLAEIPSHGHTATTAVSISDPGHAHAENLANTGGGLGAGGFTFAIFGAGSIQNTGTDTTGITASATTTLTTSGGNAVHNNVQPSIVALPCIKLG